MMALIACVATVAAGLNADRKRWGLALSFSLLALGAFITAAA